MWNNPVLGLGISFLVGAGAFDWVICPKKKRREVANRITAVIVLLAYLSCVLPSLIMTWYEFNLKLFLLEGVLVGIVTMGIIYGIAQAIHWAIKGKPM